MRIESEVYDRTIAEPHHVSQIEHMHTWNQVSKANRSHCDEAKVVAIEERPAVFEQQEEASATGQVNAQEDNGALEEDIIKIIIKVQIMKALN